MTNELKYVESLSCYGKEYMKKEECKKCSSSFQYQCRYKYYDERF
jgi:hypothetical protein